MLKQRVQPKDSKTSVFHSDRIAFTDRHRDKKQRFLRNMYRASVEIQSSKEKRKKRQDKKQRFFATTAITSVGSRRGKGKRQEETGQKTEVFRNYSSNICRKPARQGKEAGRDKTKGRGF